MGGKKPFRYAIKTSGTFFTGIKVVSHLSHDRRCISYCNLHLVATILDLVGSMVMGDCCPLGVFS